MGEKVAPYKAFSPVFTWNGVEKIPLSEDRVQRRISSKAEKEGTFKTEIKIMTRATEQAATITGSGCWTLGATT